MGGGPSKPSPPPTIVEQDPPAGSGQSSIVYADRPDTPRLDGLTRSMANECSNCNLQIASGISSSSVKLSREFGEVTDVQCKRYRNDKKRVNDKQMSFQDFLGNLKAGRYLRNLDNGYCEQITVSEEDATKFKKMSDFDENKLQSVRIQKVSSGGFSADTKARLTPSIPFKLSFQGQEITVKTMSVYHPCPLRIEGVQPDAVFSLNDPSFDEGSGYIILIPLIAKNSADPSVEFFDRVLPQINALMAPEATGQYTTRNIATGTNWSLTKVFSTGKRTGESYEVQNGYYEWKGMPALERVREDSNNTITYAWKESGKPSPRYIMLDTPVAISSSSLSSITTTLPVTPSSDAVHAVLYSSDPFQRGIVHKLGPANCTTTRESFTDMNGVKEEFCDAWTAWAQDTKPKGYTTQQIFALIFNVLVFIAMGVGAYLALAAVLRFYDTELKNVSTGLGKITAVVFKSLRQKAGEMKGMTSGFGGLGGLAALASGKVPPQMLQQINQNTVEKSITPEQIAKIQQANPDTSIANAKAAADKAAKEAAEKAEEEAAAKAAAIKEEAKAASDKAAKDNAAKALAAVKEATEAKKAAAAEKAAAEQKRKEDEAKAAAAEQKRKEDEANAEKVAAEKLAAAEQKRKEDEAKAAAAEQKKAAEEAKNTTTPTQAATTPKQSALDALRNRRGTIGKLSPEGQAQSGLLKTPGLGRGRTKPGRGRVGSTRRAGY